MSVFVFEPDLIFSSKLDGLSRLMGVEFRIFAELDEFMDAAYAEKPGALIVNLDVIKSDKLQTLLNVGIPVMGYYSHVHSEVARAAVQLGVGEVVTRGAFFANSQSLVRGLLKFKKQGL